MYLSQHYNQVLPIQHFFPIFVFTFPATLLFLRFLSSPISVITFCCHSSSRRISSSPQELQKEKNSTTVQLDQSSRRLSQLEEEKKSADQSLKRTQGLLDDLKGNLVVGMAMAEGSGYFRELSEVIPVCLFALQLNQKGRRRS